MEGLQQGLRDVVDVVGHPAHELAVGLTVEVGQRQSLQLGTDLTTQVVHGSLDRGVEQESLQEHQQGGAGVQAQGPGHDDAEPVEIDAGTDDDIGVLLQQGDDLPAIATLTGLAELVDEFAGRHATRLRDVSAQLFSDDAAEDDVGGPAQDLGANDVEGHRDHSHDDDGGQDEAMRLELAEQPPEGRAEGDGLFGDPAAASS